jgi:ATP-dependent Lon protease
VRSRAKLLEIPDATFRESDLHIHFPAGAIPKDGPSAGIALTLAIASVLSRARSARRRDDGRGDAARQGARDRRREGKDLAAYRAGLREVIMPKGNEKDLRDVPPEVRANMAFTFVATMDEVLRLALLPAPEPDWRIRSPPEPSPTADGPAASGRLFPRLNTSY